tara:strand:- start:1879 stop:3888 length:2010 start_codon:yes stop_codon:yes gene_type:complete
MKSQSISPPNGAVLNYIYVLLEWPQIEVADAYNIQISNEEDFSEIILDIIDSTNLYIDRDNIDWSSTYYWRVRPLFNNNPGNWLNSNYFITGEKKSNADASIYQPDLFQDGLTIFGSFYNYFSAAIDKNGKEVWNTGEKNIVYYNINKYLDIFGCYSNPSLEHNLPAIQININSEFEWEEPNDDFVHHDFFRLPNGNYLGIIATTELGPIPIGPWTADYQSIGFQADGLNIEFPWVGDKLVEWDKDTKEIVWSWNIFDHFSKEDFDTDGGTWLPNNTGYQQYDWTHVNAAIFSEDESAIYISVRHLSRITKIAYPSGEIIWNMGRDMPSGEVEFGHDLGFSFQHSLQLVDNGNVITLDNGNLSELFLGTPSPISRGLEINISNDTNPVAEIVWDYSLESDLFGFASGNIQKLDNGNYLITTVGGNGTSLEISADGTLIWQGEYNLCEPICAVYRANRILGLYPIAYSITLKDYMLSNQNSGIFLASGDNNFSFNINNEGLEAEEFKYKIVDQLDWFSSVLGSVYIQAGESSVVTINGIIPEINSSNNVILTVTPVHKESQEKIINFNTYYSPNSIVKENVFPNKISLGAPYPNPFNSLITIPVSGFLGQNINITVTNILGKEITDIYNGKLAREKYNFYWNAVEYPTGLYFIKLISNKYTSIRKIVYMK